MTMFPGKSGALQEIRRVQEIAKRPSLMQIIQELGRSTFFKDSWTSNTFRTLAAYDPTVREDILYGIQLISLSGT